MFIPISDANPLRHIRTAWITGAIIIACIGVFIVELSLPKAAQEYWVARLAYTPGYWFGPNSSGVDMSLLSQEPLLILSPVISQFLHADLWHLIGNLLFLRVLGDNIEDSLGHGRFLFFYLLCGVVAAVAQTLPDPHTVTGMIGASGAISGIIGAYVVLHPTARIKILLFWFLRPVVPALALFGLWFVLQLLFAIGDDGSSRVAWWAHLGGFVFGAATIKAFTPHRRAVLPDRTRDPMAMPESSALAPSVPEPIHRQKLPPESDLMKLARQGARGPISSSLDLGLDLGLKGELILVWLTAAIITGGLLLLGKLSEPLFISIGIFAIVLSIRAGWRGTRASQAPETASLPIDPFDALDNARTVAKSFGKTVNEQKVELADAGRKFDDLLSGKTGPQDEIVRRRH